MSLSKTLKKPPRKIAEEIIHSISEKDTFEKIEIAGPGFINFTFSKAYLYSEMNALMRDGLVFLRSDIGKGRRVQVEFVSANPTGPLHLGHGRGAAVGNALSNLLKAGGYKVEKEFYVNDAGRQVRLLGMSVFAKYKQLSGMDYPFPEDGYRGDYVEELAKELKIAYEEQFLKMEFDEVAEKFIDSSYKKCLPLLKRP